MKICTGAIQKHQCEKLKMPTKEYAEETATLQFATSTGQLRGVKRSQQSNKNTHSHMHTQPNA